MTIMHRVLKFRWGAILILSCCWFLGRSATAQSATNDMFSSAKILPASGEISVSNLGATAEPGEPSPLQSSPHATLWYEFRAPTNGIYSVALSISKAPFLMAIFEGDAWGSLRLLGATPARLDSTTELVVAVEKGVVYRIQIDSLRPAQGSFTLRTVFNAGTPPANDLFANRIHLDGLTNRVTGTTTGASMSRGDPAKRSGSVWYAWLVPQSGMMAYRWLAGSNNDVLLATGRDPGTFRYPSEVTGMGLTEGETILICIASYSTAGGAFDFELGVAPAPHLTLDSESVLVSEGTPAEVTAHYTGAGDGSFQWYHDEQSVDGETNLNLRLPAVTADLAGFYRLVASNEFGLATSAVVNVQTRLPGAAAIDGLPTEVSVLEGAPVLLSPSRVGGTPPLAIWWERSLPGGWVAATLTNWAYELPSSTWEDTGLYRLTVSNQVAVETKVVQLVVDTSPQPPVVLAQPEFLNVLAGAPVEVPVLVSGHFPSVFYWRTNGVEVSEQPMAAFNPGALPPGTTLLLEGTVSNSAGATPIAPITVTVVGTPLYREDFEGNPASTPWSGAAAIWTSRYGQGEARLTKKDQTALLPAGAGDLAIGWDVWAVGSWDGSSGQYGVDLVQLTLGTNIVFRSGFSNNDGEGIPGSLDFRYFSRQPYPAEYGEGEFDPRAGAIGIDPVETERLGISSLYRLRHKVAWGGGSLPMRIQTLGLTDEWVHIDNLYVTTLPKDLAWIRPKAKAVVVPESAEEAVLEIVREGRVDLPVTVRYAITGHGAVASRDFIGGNGSVTLQPGVTSAFIHVPIITHPLPSRSKDFGVWLLDAGTNGVFSETPFIGVSILDDQASLTLVSLTNSIPEGVYAQVATVKRTGDLRLEQLVELAVVSETHLGTTRISHWAGGTNTMTNILYMHFLPGSNIAVDPDPSSFPGFVKPATNALPYSKLQAVSDSEPDLPTDYRVVLQWPVLPASEPGQELRFTVLDNDLTPALRTFSLTPQKPKGTVLITSTIAPKRMRIGVESSENMREWTLRGAVGSNKLLLLTDAPGTHHRFYRLVLSPY